MDVTASLLPEPSARTRTRQKVFISLCLISIAFNYLDRATVSIAVPELRREFGASATQIGALLSVWSLSYAIGQLPAGYLIDRYGVRLLASGGLFIWSIFQLLGGLAGSFTQLFATRGLLGAAESPTGPSNARVVASWFPERARGLATGIYVSGTQVGPAIAPPLLTALMLWLGWRMMFVAMGLSGLGIAAIYFGLYRDVEAVTLSDQDRVYLEIDTSASAQEITPARWLSLLRFATAWGFILGAFCQGWVSWIFVGWLPAYLETEFHLSVAHTGLLAALPFIGGIGGSLCGGLISDYYARRSTTAVSGRKVPIVAGLLGLAVFTAATGFSRHVELAITFSFLALFSSQVMTSGMWVAAAVLVPRNRVASISTMFNSASFIGATLSPLVTGFTLDRTGSFFTALLLGSGIGMLGAFLMYLLIRNPLTTTIESAITPASLQTAR